MYLLLAILLLLVILGWLILQLPVFGGKPAGQRLLRIKNLDTYQDGALQNLSPTPMKPDGVSYLDMMKGMLTRNDRRSPAQALPSLVPDFSVSPQTKFTWFGHSSYLLQVNGFNILVDPVFSRTPSPFSFLGYKSFNGTDFIQAGQLPELDVVLITHDHYDHLDYPTILKLVPKTKTFLTSTGVGAHLEKWQVPAEKIQELSWHEEITIDGLRFIAKPARHFTGRLFKRNQTLWSSFILQANGQQIYIGGDSGYDAHFKEIGDAYGPFDLSILECGQYNLFWPYIHMFPEQTVKAAKDLKSKVLLPVHWGKFRLAMHDWDDPVKRVVKQAAADGQPITTPQLGETIIVGGQYPDEPWWN